MVVWLLWEIHLFPYAQQCLVCGAILLLVASEHFPSPEQRLLAGCLWAASLRQEHMVYPHVISPVLGLSSSSRAYPGKHNGRGTRWIMLGGCVARQGLAGSRIRVPMLVYMNLERSFVCI